MLSTFGALNGAMMTAPRIFYAMASGASIASTNRLNPTYSRTRMPHATFLS